MDIPFACLARTETPQRRRSPRPSLPQEKCEVISADLLKARSDAAEAAKQLQEVQSQLDKAAVQERKRNEKAAAQFEKVQARNEEEKTKLKDQFEKAASADKAEIEGEQHHTITCSCR